MWDYGQGMETLRVFWDEAIALNPAMDTRDERHMPLSGKGELAGLWRDPIVSGYKSSRFSELWGQGSPTLEQA